MVLQRLETSYLHSDIHAVFLPVIPATDPYTWYICNITGNGKSDLQYTYVHVF